MKEKNNEIIPVFSNIKISKTIINIDIDNFDFECIKITEKDKTLIITKKEILEKMNNAKGREQLSIIECEINIEKAKWQIDYYNNQKNKLENILEIKKGVIECN